MRAADVLASLHGAFRDRVTRPATARALPFVRAAIPFRVRIESACPHCGGLGFVGGAYGRICGWCDGSGISLQLGQVFEQVDIVRQMRRMAESRTPEAM